uniref:TauD domain-containing protein n=1 Tax=Meloidogyne hapla TaxID=6305 RepID=A0A1I8C2D8_MELHA
MRCFLKKYIIRSVTNLFEKRAIKATFKDGYHRLFPYVWLRDCSLDDKTYVISNAMKGRLHSMRDFDVNVKPINFRLDSKGKSLLVEWPGNVNSRYEPKWLRTHCPGSKAVREKRRQIYLGYECIRLWEDRSTIESRLKRFSHQLFLEDDKVLHDFLKAVCVDGIAVLKGTEYSPDLRNEVLWSIIRRIGMVQPTHFGETFEVCPKPDASNMAYANTQELPYHTDFPSLQDPPQLQMLHMCKKAECGGGKSMFVDGFSIAKKMFREHYDEYKLLCYYPLEFIEEGFDVHNIKGFQDKEERVDFAMVARHKTFNWFLDMAENDSSDIQELYDALKLFTKLCYLPENQLIFPLESGDTVLWANTRILHARSAYKLIGTQERERYVLGCYFSWDTIKSRIRLIRRQLKLPEDQEMV